MKAKKPAVRFECAECHKLFMGKDVAVDHIIPVIPIDGTFETWDVFIGRLFCDKTNLQVLCSYRLKEISKHNNVLSCHHKKTNRERQERKELEGL